MSNPPPGFQLDGPAKPVRPRKMALGDYRPDDDIRDIGSAYAATGKVVDGDTIQLNSDLTGRLFGLDAFERGQMGYRQGQTPLDLGKLATDQLMNYIRPSQPAFGTGRFSYGRPVVTLGQGLTDPARASLLSGTALAAPSFMDRDPERRGIYMEDERLARLNRQGAHATEYMSPDIYRSAKRWGTKLRPDEEAVWTSDVPEFKPDLKRLTDEQEQDYYRFLASNVGRQDFGQADLDSYWTGKGFTGSAPADEKFIESVRKGNRYGTIDYSAWDQQALRDFNLANGFAGLRPEVQQAYNAILSDPGSTPDSIRQFADVNGLSFDPRDIDAFYAARARGENPNVPIPIINPGDGAKGAGGRGSADTLGFLDELGGVVDAMAPVWMQEQAQQLTGGPESFKHRETIWNSDRSFGDIYRNNLRQNRAIIDYDETRHPYARAGGQVVGGFFLPFASGIRGAGNLAKAGAVEGGLYGYASGDGTPMQRLANVPLNATVGGALGLAFGKGEELLRPLIKQGVSKVGGRLSSKAAPAAPDAPPVGPWGSPTATISPLSPRQIDRLNIPPSQTATPQLPALGDRIPSAAPEAGERARSWIDVADYPPDGFVLDAPLAGRMDMGANNALPSLSSPRIRDMIDVNANRPTRLLDGPTDAMVRAATARVQPADILPRPANEVQSLDEFSRISEGLYPNVRAPNERDLLTPRQFPSRANPDNMLNRKGPLDLAAFVRSEGGVADFRGELRAAGLSNAPRKGDDFTGGENRLGPLLNDESGSTLDDMAQRAWEAGYFPDHATRPTVDEFVTALGDTYRGVNRTFRPDDFNEIDAFNAARDQRQAVERARQEGAPLADDVGQPATLDDIIANTPPATAYDDWNNAVVSKVGNIRVDKLDTPQDIGQALKVADNVAGGFDAGRRGKITHAETQALAQDLGMTADDLLARRKGQAFSAEEAYAARVILAKSGNELVNMAKRLRSLGDDPGSETMAQFRKAMVRHAAIQESVSGMTAEAGRALQQFRMTANSRDLPGRFLEGLVNAGGGPERMKEAAEAIIDLARDPKLLNSFVEKAEKPRFKDKIVELWYNYLLSGPQTHAVNILSNTLTSLGQLPEHAVAAGVGAVRRAAKREEVDRVLFGEVGARTAGLLQGAKEGMREAARAFRTGESSDFITKVENQAQKAISGKKGELIRVPTRLLTAEDELFKAMARRMELSGLAVRQAGKEGLKGQAAKDRAAELLANPTDEMLDKAMDYGRYVTFQRPLGPVASKLSAMTNAAPWMKAFLPFVRTPTNLIKFAAERSPFAPMMKEWRKEFAAGGARRDLAVARMMVGTGVGMAIAELAAQGVITGSEPSDRNRKGLQYGGGWQPYSIKIGDTYYSYKRLDPFAITFGTAADIATLSNGMSESQREKGAGLLVASIMSNLASKTWVTGISDALSSLQDPERSAGRFVNRLVGSALVPTGVAQLTRTIDPVARETDDTMDYVQSRIPGLSDNLLPKRDVWGQPIVNEGGIGPDIVSPIWTSTDRNDPITQEALRVDATVSKPQRRDMTAEQYDKMQAVTGATARRWIGQLIASPEYKALDRDAQADAISDLMTKARKAAKANVLSGDPILDDRPVPKGRSAKPSGLPDGFVLDPPPAGFVLDR